MDVSDHVRKLLHEGGLSIELEAVVLGARSFKANGQDVAKINVIGTPGGPMGHNVQCHPYGIFELDAEMKVFQGLGNQFEPRRIKFRADLKPINSSGGYVMHLLEIVEEDAKAGGSFDQELR